MAPLQKLSNISLVLIQVRDSYDTERNTGFKKTLHEKYASSHPSHYEKGLRGKSHNSQA